MAEINTGVDYCHDRTATSSDVPCVESIHPRNWSQPPLRTQLRIISRRSDLNNGVQPYRNNDVFVFQDLDDLFRVGQRFDQIQPLPVQRAPDHRTANISYRFFDLIHGQRQVEPDHDGERVVLHVRVVFEHLDCCSPGRLTNPNVSVFF